MQRADWPRLRHAYGRAADTPEHLRALSADDREARSRAVAHLESAILHQGTPWTATAPAAVAVAELLQDGRLDASTRADLLSFLVGVAEAAAQADASVEALERLAAFDIEPFLDAQDDEALYEHEGAANSLHARALLGCIRAAPVLMQAMLAGLGHDDPRVRARAAMGAATLVGTAALRGRAEEVESRLLALAQAAGDSDERSAHVLALGASGCAPAAFLRDPSPAVRMCAALAPGLAADPAAVAELVGALENAASIDGWFAEKPPQFRMHPRFAVVARLVERVGDFGRLVCAAEAVLRVTSKSCVDFDWGPLLAAAFPDGDGVARTEAQRRLLRALVDKAELWDPVFGNPRKWFAQAGLAYDRRRCAAQAGA